MDVGFYQIFGTTIAEEDTALIQLLDKMLAANHKVLIHCRTPERMDKLNTLLWTDSRTGFRPHGTAGDGAVDFQPVLLTTELAPSYAASAAIAAGLPDNCRDIAASMPHLDRFCIVFNQHPENAQKARSIWKTFRDLEPEITPSFYIQTANGWQKKA